MPIRVLIVDDHPVVREGLKAALLARPEIDVIGEAQNGLEAVAVCRSLRPQVVVMDLTMPEMDGITATRQIRAETDEVRVLGLTIHETEEYLLEFLRAGGSGYVLKRAGIQDLALAIQAVARGEGFLYPSAATAVIVDYLQKHGADDADNGLLTAKEWEVLRLVAEGYSNQQIADTIHRSIKTVQTHRASLMRKLGLHDRTEIVRFAIRKGLIEA
jgi:two-component system response regulator NreC